MGTPAFETRSQLFNELDADTIFMMGDNPALPKMPERPTLADFFATGSIPARYPTCCKAPTWPKKPGWMKRLSWLACFTI